MDGHEYLPGGCKGDASSELEELVTSSFEWGSELLLTTPLTTPDSELFPLETCIPRQCPGSQLYLSQRTPAKSSSLSDQYFFSLSAVSLSGSFSCWTATELLPFAFG